MIFSSVMSSGICLAASITPLLRLCDSKSTAVSGGEMCAFLTGNTLDTLVLGGSGLLDTAADVAEGHGILGVGSGKIFSGLLFL